MPNGDDWIDSDEDPPPSPDEVYLCLLDFLGFKGMVTGNKLRSVAKSLRDARARSTAVIPADVAEEHRPNSLMYSDSVLFWVEGTSQGHFDALTRTVSSFFATSFQSGLLLRGALVRGKLSIAADGDVIVGGGLIRAYELEQGQKWGGIVVDPRVADDEPAGFSELEQSGVLTEWRVPWQSNPSPRPHTVIAWPRDTAVTEAELRTAYKGWFDTAPEEGRAKLEETLRFFQNSGSE